MPQPLLRISGTYPQAQPKTSPMLLVIMIFNTIQSTTLFSSLQDYVRQVGDNSILFDKIVQVDPNGNVLWSWDTYDHIPLSEASPFNETSVVNGQTVEDFTHANTLDWHYNDSIIYLNARNTNTFYKINQTTGDIIWACGEFGNFTLLGDNGQRGFQFMVSLSRCQRSGSRCLYPV